MKKLSILLFLFSFSLTLNASDLDSASIAKDMQRVADWQITHFRNTFSGRTKPHHIRDWTNGALYVGMYRWAKLSNDPRYLQWLKQISDRADWKLHWRKYMADDHVVGQLYLSLYRDFNDPKMITNTKASLDFIRKNPSKEPIELDNYANMERWTWCDALFMGPPLWAQLAKITGDTSYVDWMFKEFQATTEHLFDAQSALYYRDNSYIGKQVHGEKVFWARGNGWVFAGLALIMEQLTPNTPQYDYFKKIFLKMATSLKHIQTEQGHWAMSLLDAKSYPTPETSGTSFFAYGFAWGINNGLLEKDEYLPAITKAWNALTSHITDDGMLGYVQPIGAAPGQAWQDKTEVYGSGAFLAAGTEIYKMLEGIKRPTISNSKILGKAISTTDTLLDAEYANKILEKSPLSAQFVPERKDDFAWENDLIAFRVYGPALRPSTENSGTDCWLKRVNYPIIRKWYKQHAEGISYHVDHGEGYDPYHVGATAGCGGTSLWINEKRYPMNTFVEYKNVKITKEQLTFTLIYRQEVAGDQYEEHKHIRLKPNLRLFAVESSFFKNGKVAKKLPITIGLTTHSDNASLTFDLPSRQLSAWEMIDNYGLGTAIILETADVATPLHYAPGTDDAHGLFITQTNTFGKVTYYAGYGWQRAGEVTSALEWGNYVSIFT